MRINAILLKREKMEIPRMKKQYSLPKSEFTRSKMKSVGSKGVKARDLKWTDEETTE